MHCNERIDPIASLSTSVSPAPSDAAIAVLRADKIRTVSDAPAFGQESDY